MAYGDITSVPDNVQVNAPSKSTDVIKVGSGIIAVVYQDYDNGGYIKTFPIDASGNIGAVIDTHCYQSGLSHGGDPEIIHVAGTVYAIVCWAFWGTGAVLLYTVNITEAGIISNISSLIPVFEKGGNIQPHIARLPGTTKYVIASDINDDDGYMAVVNINDNGGGLSKIDEWEYEPTNAVRVNVAHVRDNYFMLAHVDELVTVYVSNAGTITKSYAHSVADGNIDRPVILPVADNIIAIFNHNGVVRVYSVNGSGQMSYLGGGTWRAGAIDPDVCIIGDAGGYRYFAIAFNRNTYILTLDTIKIKHDGTVVDLCDQWDEGTPPPYATLCAICNMENGTYGFTQTDSGGANSRLYSALIGTPFKARNQVVLID